MEETLRQWNRPVRIDRSRKHANARPATDQKYYKMVIFGIFSGVMCYLKKTYN